MPTTTTIMICGVGGQGAVLAADILARCAMAYGQDVKISEIHGMSQRGGAVTTIIRVGEEVSSMVASPGSVDYLLGFETTEALRNIHYLSPTGTLIVNDQTIQPLSVLSGAAKPASGVRKSLVDRGAHMIDAVRLAAQAGSIKAANIVMLGALSAYLPYPEDLWVQTISRRVPAKFLQSNLAAFAAPRQ